MARKQDGGRRVEALTHGEARRRNIPTAELQPFHERQEETRPLQPVRYPRTTPLEPGTARERDPDLDPQLVWNGVRIRLTQEQRDRLVATGEVEIGDAQLVWRGKDRQDWSDLVVNAPPLYVQEKVHPKALIDDLERQRRQEPDEGGTPDLFADFNGLPDPEARTEFYQHDQHWSNRMILGDSLQVMASLAEREGLRGKVQCIYLDPPYGIKFNSNWQVSTRSRDVKDGKQTDVSREPEQVKAFRDTWKDGIHSYLTYLRDRMLVARELLANSGSIFIQIGDENAHRVRGLLDEVLGVDNFVSDIAFQTTSGAGSPAIGTNVLAATYSHVLWYAKDKEVVKYRQIYTVKTIENDVGQRFRRVQLEDYVRRPMTATERQGVYEEDSTTRIYRHDNITSQSGGPTTSFSVLFEGVRFRPGNTFWKTNAVGMERLLKAGRLGAPSRNSLAYVRFLDDFSAAPVSNLWVDTRTGAFTEDKTYVVQTSSKVIQRCILMTTDPGDLVLDPTCGSGTTATVAEQWGRRWITIDTSRVALALARTRLMSARYPYYHLADSPEGRAREAAVTGKVPPEHPTHGDIRQGFVYERAPHVTLKSIANNAEIDVTWETWQRTLEPLRARLNETLGEAWEEWEIPREAGTLWPEKAQKAFHGIKAAARTEDASGGGRAMQGAAVRSWLAEINAALERAYTLDTLPEQPRDPWPDEANVLHAAWWEARIARQQEIDASIANNAEVELLYDRPYEDRSKVRVAGPFTVESLSPHRMVPADEEDLGLVQEAEAGKRRRTRLTTPPADFAQVVMEHLRTAGVHSQAKKDTIRFTSLVPWPGEYIGAEGRYVEGGAEGGGEGETERRAAIFIGPEFGTLSRPDLVAAAREATDARFDVLIACAFNFDAHAGTMTRMGALPVLQARMSPDLHMAGELKNTGKGNLFTVFGEPDIELEYPGDGMVQVRIKGVDVFDPNTGDIRSSDTDGIAAWFIDTAYDEESFFVRHAYFLGANDPYKQLKTALKAEIDEAAWSTLYRAVSRPFAKPKSGRIAVKVINHFGDEVMKVFGVQER